MRAFLFCSKDIYEIGNSFLVILGSISTRRLLRLVKKLVIEMDVYDTYALLHGHHK